MTIEKTLAEIEVLARELRTRENSVYLRALVMNPHDYLEEIFHEAGIIYDNYRKTKKALKRKDESGLSRANGDFALSIKNLADNCNRLMQSLYANDFVNLAEDRNLRNLQRNSQSAPRTDEGKTLYDIFTQVHDISQDSPTKLSRDRRGHGRTFSSSIISSDQCPSGYGIVPSDEFFRMNIGSGKLGLVDVDAWMTSQAQSYLEMTKTILQTIADQDSEHFAKRTTNRELRTQVRLARNFYQRHSRPFAIAAATAILTAGIVGGSLGTVAYQNYQKQKEMSKDLANINFVNDRKNGLLSSIDSWEAWAVAELTYDLANKRLFEVQQNLISHPEYSPSYNLKKVFGTESNLFDRTINNLNDRAKKLGTYLDNYCIRGGIAPEEIKAEKARKFYDDRKAFLTSLVEFSASNKGKIPTSDSLNALEKLIKQEEALQELESSVVAFFPRLR